MVARNRVSDCLDASPALVVGLLERREAAAVILVVAEREDGAVATAYQQIRHRALPADVVGAGARTQAVVEMRVSGVTSDVAGGCDDRV